MICEGESNFKLFIAETFGSFSFAEKIFVLLDVPKEGGGVTHGFGWIRQGDPRGWVKMGNPRVRQPKLGG